MDKLKSKQKQKVFSVRNIVLIAFGLSGMAALIYEVVWVRPLSLIFGASVYAFSIILAAFLTGFALGSWAIRKYADKTNQPLRLFSFLELGIGIYGILIIFIFRDLPALDLARIFQFSLIFALLIIPASLMGATWPVIHRAFIKEYENIGKGVGSLYSINSLGSMAGSILAEDFFDFRLDDNDRIIIADARSFLRTTDKTYDVILVNLYNGGMIPFHTHTKEALELMKSHLKPGGILLSNIIARQDEFLLRSLTRTLRATFPKVLVGASKESVSNIMAYAAVNEDYRFEFSGRYKEIAVDSRSGVLITDDRNPIEILSSEHMPEFLDLTKRVFGYESLFSM